MATRALFSPATTKCEIIKGVTFSGTSETDVAHNLKITPDFVIIINTGTQSYTLTPGTHTSAVVKITASNASATCDVIVGKITGKAR